MLTVKWYIGISISFLIIKFKPEESISIQHTIGADIIMQLDDVGK